MGRAWRKRTQHPGPAGSPSAAHADPIATEGELRALPWRTGRKVGRTVYAVVGKEPSDSDILIGVMDTPLLAIDVVMAHNHARTCL